jgi:hypothetical protein
VLLIENLLPRIFHKVLITINFHLFKIKIFLCNYWSFILPLGRLGNEEDIAGAALYFASHAGSWVSGAMVRIDGGTLLHGKDLGREYAIATKSKL